MINDGLSVGPVATSQPSSHTVTTEPDDRILMINAGPTFPSASRNLLNSDLAVTTEPDHRNSHDQRRRSRRPRRDIPTEVSPQELNWTTHVLIINAGPTPAGAPGRDIPTEVTPQQPNRITSNLTINDRPDSMSAPGRDIPTEVSTQQLNRRPAFS
jgi:hypothetical protein